MTNVCVNFDKTHAWRPDVHSTGAIALLVGFLVTQTSSAIRVLRLHLRLYLSTDHLLNVAEQCSAVQVCI